MESLSRHSHVTAESMDDASPVRPESQDTNEKGYGSTSRRSVEEDNEENTVPNDERDENIADESDFTEETDMEVANQTNTDSIKTKAVQKKSTAIKNIFRNTLAKNKTTLKIKLKKQDIIDKPNTAQPMSLRQNVINKKKCCYGCKDKKIIAKEEPKSKILSKLKIFNRSKYNNIVECPKSTPIVPFIKKLKIRNAPPKEMPESIKVKPIKLILKRNTNDEFASSRGLPQSDIESDVENISRDQPETYRKSQTSRYSEQSVLKDVSPVEENYSDGNENTEGQPPSESLKVLDPFDPEKEFECSDDSQSEVEEINFFTCAHCNTFSTHNKKDLISHYKTCSIICPAVICDPVTNKSDQIDKKKRCTYCNVYTSSSKTMLRNHLKACRFKPVTQRGRPKKIKEVKEMDSCKFCNFKHPDVNVFLRHLRFCNAASAPNIPSSEPSASSTLVDETGTQIHKCSSCNYVNSNLNIFMYHLKLCNKNYNNLSLKEMLLKYKQRPNIIGYSKPPSYSEIRSCDSSKNIPSSSNKIMPSVNVNANNCDDTIVQKTHVPSLFDPIEDECNSGYDSIQKYIEQNKLKQPRKSDDVIQSTYPVNLEGQSIFFAQDEYSKSLDRMKPVELSESSCSEATITQKINNARISAEITETQVMEEEPDTEVIHGEMQPFGHEYATEMPPVMENTACPVDEPLNNITSQGNTDLIDAPLTGIPESLSHSETNRARINLNSLVNETTTCQTNESPINAVQFSLENTAEEGKIPSRHSICTAQHIEETVWEEKTLQLEECVLQASVSLEAVTTEISKLIYATTNVTESIVHSSAKNIKENVISLLSDTLSEALSKQGLETNKVSSEEHVLDEEGGLGPRRLSVEHFENIASTYYAGQTNSEDEIEDELIRIDPNDILENKIDIEHTDAKVSENADNLISRIPDNDPTVDHLAAIPDKPEKNIVDKKVDDVEIGDQIGIVKGGSMLIDSEDSNDEKEVDLTLDLGSIHDSLSDAKALSPIVHPSEGDGTLSQVSSIPKDESVDQDNNTIDDVESIQNEDIEDHDDDEEEDDDEEFDSQRTCLNCKSFESDDLNVLIAHIKECSNVYSDDDSDAVEIDEPDENERKNNDAVVAHQNTEVASVENSNCAIVENHSEAVATSRKRKNSEVDNHPKNEVIFKIPKPIIPLKISASENRHTEIMNEENETQEYGATPSATDEPGPTSQSDIGENEPMEGINENVVDNHSKQDMQDPLQNEVTSTEVEMEIAYQDGAADAELFCSHCNQYSTFEVDELLNHFKQCTAVINEPGATPYISSEINELASNYDSDDCKQIINAKYTNILLNQEHTLPSPMRISSPISESLTPKSVHPAESPRYMTELTTAVSSEYTIEGDLDDTGNIEEEGNQS